MRACDFSIGSLVKLIINSVYPLYLLVFFGVAPRLVHRFELHCLILLSFNKLFIIYIQLHVHIVHIKTVFSLSITNMYCKYFIKLTFQSTFEYLKLFIASV